MMPSTPSASAPGWTEEFESWLRELQAQTLALAVPVLIGLGILSLSNTGGPSPLRSAAVAAALFTLAGGVTLLRRRYPRPTAFLLVGGMLIMDLVAVVWLQMSPALILLVLPVGLGTLIIGRLSGVATAFVSSAVVLLLPGGWAPLSSPLRVLTLVALWLTLGMIWVTLNPLVQAVHWAWSGYEQSRALLEKNRNYQVRLYETLEDLQEANQQLLRLNRLTQGLRQVAEDERRAKEEFVANVSHELRTPLNMVVGFSEMILQSPETYGDAVSSTLLADLEVILRNSQHLSGLIDDVLDMSQIEADQMALTKERVSLKELIESALIAVRPLFESKHLELNADIDPNLPDVFCDRMRIREVLLNLLSNAGRFTEIGGVTVQARGTAGEVIVSVADTGPGIPEAARRRLFQPFQQLDNTIRRRYGGTGLGLSISKSFVELHDGRVWVESEEGEGTTFFFSLPIDPLPPLDADNALRWFNPYQPYESRSRPLRIQPQEVAPRWILVEQGTALKRLLTRYVDHVELVRVPGWGDVQAEIERNPAQVVLINTLDVGRALAEIRSGAPLPYHVPTLVCSVPGVEEAADNLGVTDYLVKPISRENLLAALKSLPSPVRTVLVVDDEPDALRLFWRMLSSSEQGYRMLRASDGQQALEILKRERPDVILLDLMMPEMDGFRFLSVRSEDPDLQAIPVILISARDPLGHPIVTDALAVTADRGLSVRELLSSVEAISKILGRATALPEPSETPDA